MNRKWCMCTTLDKVARDGFSTCSICGGQDAYGMSKDRPLSKKKTIISMQNYEFKDTAPLSMSNEFVDTGYKPNKDFKPEYFTGLPRDVKRAKKYVGASMEFSNDCKEWTPGTLDAVRNSNTQKYCRKYSGAYEYMRTCLETFEPKTKYIIFNAGRIPAPEDVEPERGTRYFHLTAWDEEGYTESTWAGIISDKIVFKNGIYLKEEHIQEVVSVIRGIMGRAE